MANERRNQQAFTWQQGDFNISQCANCKNKRPGAATCNAFPQGIPSEILLNQHDHKESFPGDQGIRFDPKVPEKEGEELAQGRIDLPVA